MEQQVQFATSADGTRIGYAAVGQGPTLVRVASWLFHLRSGPGMSQLRHWWDDLARDYRLVQYDQRGCGFSDRDVTDLSFEARVSDLETVVEALGLERFALLGVSMDGAVAIEYAVRYPEAVSRLVLYGSFAQGWLPGNSADSTDSETASPLGGPNWGMAGLNSGEELTSSLMPGATRAQRQRFYGLQQECTSLDNAATIQTELAGLDVVHRLSQVSAPTLVLHVRKDGLVPFQEGCRIAALIPGARFVPLESKNHLLLEQERAWPVLLSEVRHFLVPGADGRSSSEEVAAMVGAERPDFRSHTAPDGTVTILFSDIEGSTAMTERLGDRRMQEVLRAHNSIVRRQVTAHGGFEVKSMGDGFMLAFSSARRALDCAVAMQQAFSSYNEDHPDEPLLVRMGLHTGEVIGEGDDFYGRHVIMASRIVEQAESGQILVSSLLKELTDSAGDIRFGEVQEVELKGLAGLNRVYAVDWK